MNIPEVKTDKSGRIVDKQGRPLRWKKKGQLAFYGKAGKPHPQAERLAIRQKAYDDLKEKQGYKRPGSQSK